MVTLTYLDDRHLWINGMTVRGVCRYQTLVTLLTDAGPFWFWLTDYEQATTRPSMTLLAPLPHTKASSELAMHLIPVDGWADSANLFSWN